MMGGEGIAFRSKYAASPTSLGSVPISARIKNEPVNRMLLEEAQEQVCGVP